MSETEGKHYFSGPEERTAGLIIWALEATRKKQGPANGTPKVHLRQPEFVMHAINEFGGNVTIEQVTTLHRQLTQSVQNPISTGRMVQNPSVSELLFKAAERIRKNKQPPTQRNPVAIKMIEFAERTFPPEKKETSKPNPAYTEKRIAHEINQLIADPSVEIDKIKYAWTGVQRFLARLPARGKIEIEIFNYIQKKHLTEKLRKAQELRIIAVDKKRKEAGHQKTERERKYDEFTEQRRNEYLDRKFQRRRRPRQ